MERIQWQNHGATTREGPAEAFFLRPGTRVLLPLNGKHYRWSPVGLQGRVSAGTESRRNGGELKDLLREREAKRRFWGFGPKKSYQICGESVKRCTWLVHTHRALESNHDTVGRYRNIT